MRQINLQKKIIKKCSVLNWILTCVMCNVTKYLFNGIYLMGLVCVISSDIPFKKWGARFVESVVFLAWKRSILIIPEAELRMATFVENPQLKMISFQMNKHGYLLLIGHDTLQMEGFWNYIYRPFN